MKKNKNSIFLKRNFQIIYAIILIILIPLTIVLNTIWSVKSFKHNIDIELQREALLIGKLFNTSVFKETSNLIDLQDKVKAIGESIKEITTFNILIPEGENFKIFSSLEEDKINTIDDGLNNVIAWHQNESIATLVADFNEEDELVRYWEVVTPLVDKDNNKKALLTLRMSLEPMDSIVKNTLTNSYIILLITIFIVILLLTLNTRLFEYALLFKKLKEVDKMKDEFISMASHELRTPITTLKGFISMILDGDFGELNKDGKKNLKIMELSTNRLNFLVEDLLNVSRIEQKRLVINLKEVNTKEILNSIRDEFQLRTKEKGLGLKLNLEENFPNILADEDKLRQVLVNLMGNAVKYTIKGNIELSAKFKKDFVTISIKDSGIGMSSKDREGLFSKFYRIENEKTKGITGTGLGLWITKQLIELMNGKIYIDSIENIGTKIYFTIPIFKK